MLVSVFTPTHNPRYLPRLAASLARQQYQNFEWIIVPNGNARPTDVHVDLPQSRVIPYPGSTQKIGELKHFCCLQARGHLLVEADHDDELTPDALEQLVEAFTQDPDLSFAYSNCCEVMDGKPWTYGAEYGWTYRPFAWDGEHYLEACAFDPSPASFSKIWYAPNHVRAWRADFYRALGGHDVSLAVLDDHDLLARTYIRGKVKKIDRCLYIYHVHEANTWRGPHNALIQTETLNLHDKYIEPLASKWCLLNGLKTVDLGSLALEILQGRWPFENGEVGMLVARDLLCKLPSPTHTMNEAFRCLAPNGWFLTDTPSTDGRGAFQDPRHVSFWNSNSFWYYTSERHAGFIGTLVRFQLNRINNYFPSPWYEQHQMPYVRADLLKFSGRVPGIVDFHDKEDSHAAWSSTGNVRFTLLTPTIERESLMRCCRSVDRQTHSHWQHIVILDGPAWSISTSELQHPNRLFLVTGQRHHDFGNTARHLAYDHIKGDYVIGLDDDNYLLHDRALATLNGSLHGADWAVYPMVLQGQFFFHDPPGPRRTDQGQMVYRPVIRGQPIRYPRTANYDGDGTLCDWLKSLCAPRMLAEVGPLVMYERANGLVPEHEIQAHPGIRELMQRHWPAQKPDRAFDGQGWLNEGVPELLSRHLSARAALVIELGSWLGLSTRWLLDRAPRAVVFAVDHWQGSPELMVFADKLPHLFETFLANNWNYRDRLVPMKMSTRAGLQAIHGLALKIVPDLIYLDADHSEEAVTADVALAVDLFPHTPIVGDDYVHEEVQRAVQKCSEALHKRLETQGYAWALT